MDRLLEKDLSAAGFAADVHDALPAFVDTVVVGGGIVGASIAYHLTEMGVQDVLVLERNVLGSGTSWHAAGLVSGIRSTTTLTRLAGYGIELYARLGQQSGVDVSFNQCGSLLMARTSGRLEELRHTEAVARQAGVAARLLSPEQARELFPLLAAETFLGALHQPGDGHVNPGLATVALAKVAHERGAAIREGVEVLEVLTEDEGVRGVRTSAGDVACRRVVVAGGLWTRDLLARQGVVVPLHAAEHVHVRTGPVAGAGPALPVLRDLDGYSYVRSENGCLLVGAFEPDGRPRPTEEVGAHGFAQFPADWEHFAAVRAAAEKGVPDLADAGYERFLNAPESFTPDAAFCLGETAELSELFVAAGFNSQGVIYAPGAGRALAEWMLTGAPTFDATSVDVRRFARMQGTRRYLRERTQESLGRLYAMHWPFQQPATARDKRLSPLHARLAAAGACFGETAGWERADWFAVDGAEPRHEYRYGRQSWFEASAAEHRAARNAVAVFDQSPVTKVEVAGPDALRVLQRWSTADVDVAPGRLVPTLVLNVRGGIELEATVVRLGPTRFWVVTPAGAQTTTLSTLRRLVAGRAAAVFDATAGFGAVAVVGPASRELLRRISPDDFSDVAQPHLRAREIEVADAFAWCLRTSGAGELGYELYPSAEQAVGVLDAVLAAGDGLGVRLAGEHALDSLRLEAGYRRLGHDLGPATDPYEAGLGSLVTLDKPSGFVGDAATRRARQAGPARQLIHLALHDPGGQLGHAETILADGRAVGQVTSGAHGHTLGRPCGLGLVDSGVDLRTASFLVDCRGVLAPAEVSARPFYDPDGLRLRG